MIPTMTTGTYSPQPTLSGTGEASQELCAILDETYHHGWQPANLDEWHEALDALLSLPLKCSKPAWDGYDAEPLSNGSLESAKAALCLLFSVHAAIPDIGADADGEVAFEWAHLGNSVIFTFQRNGMLSYTALYDGVQEEPGTLAFSQWIPSFLLDKVAKVYGA